MPFTAVEDAIVYVLKDQKAYILKQAEACLSEGNAEDAQKHRKRIDAMGFGVPEKELTEEHEEARVDELFVWIERFDMGGIPKNETTQSAYDLLRNDEDLFLV